MDGEQEKAVLKNIDIMESALVSLAESFKVFLKQQDDLIDFIKLRDILIKKKSETDDGKTKEDKPK